MLRIIERIDRTLASIESAVLVPAFLFMLGLMIVQVTCRYFLKMPLGWSEELVRYFYIGTTFLGAAVATRERQHIEINFITVVLNKYDDRPDLKNKIIIGCNLLRDGVVVIFMSVVVYQTWLLVHDQFIYNMVSPAMQIPMYLATSTILVGCFLTIVHSIFLMILNPAGLGLTGYEEDGGEDTCIS